MSLATKPSRRPDDAAASDIDGSQPIAPLTQEFASVPSPPLLPPPENSPRPDVDPYLSPPQEDFSSASNASSPTNQATIDSASHTRGAEDIGWEQYFSHKIKYKGEGISLKSLFLVSGCPTQSSNISSVGLVTHERRTNNVHIRYRFPIPSISNCGKSMV